MSFEWHSIVQVDQVPQRSFRGLMMHQCLAHAFSLLAVCMFSLILCFCLALACAQFSCTPMFNDACVDKAQRPSQCHCHALLYRMCPWIVHTRMAANCRRPVGRQFGSNAFSSLSLQCREERRKPCRRVCIDRAYVRAQKHDSGTKVRMGTKSYPFRMHTHNIKVVSGEVTEVFRGAHGRLDGRPSSSLRRLARAAAALGEPWLCCGCGCLTGAPPDTPSLKLTQAPGSALGVGGRSRSWDRRFHVTLRRHIL